MRLNENIQIVGNGVILVPYEAKHVPKYHAWMQSSELQELTASEPLSLEEEYAMQRTWREDNDKLTFLILCKDTFDKTSNEIEALIGDTNLFLSFNEETNQTEGECEIMIAETKARGKHLGWESMLLMLKYAITNLKLHKFVSKIGMDNEKSIKMFEKMNFKETKRIEVFREISMELTVNDKWLNWLDTQVTFEIKEYK